MPPVQTPLSWTIWSRTCDRAARVNSFRMGALKQSEHPVPERESERFVRSFHGRAALQSEFHGDDRRPVASGVVQTNARQTQRLPGSLPRRVSQIPRSANAVVTPPRPIM